jgi:hypothetical protein
MHAAPPAMFVICFESVAITMRNRALEDRRGRPAPIPRQHPLRWVLAPRHTWSAWRLNVLAATQSPAAPATEEAAKRGPALGAPGYETRVRSNVSQRPQASARKEIVMDLLRQNPELTASEVRAVLARRGDVLSLRTAQRLRAQAARGAAASAQSRVGP